MQIIIIDGQGGGIGRALIEKIKASCPGVAVIAVGTNSLATSAMLKAGADKGATGESAAVYCSSRAKIIAGPVGIVLANAMLGEISPAIAAAVGESEAYKVLIPVEQCRTRVAGTVHKSLSGYLEDAVAEIRALVAQLNKES
jgi:uncharacterized protein YdbL (DUF1318 family)